MEINRLLSDELSYELAIRGCNAGRTVDEKRHLLRELLYQEKQNIIMISTTNLEPTQEFAVCSAKLDELMGHIEEFDFSNRENEYRRINARLEHISGRLQRIDSGCHPAAVEMKKELQRLKDQLKTRLDELYQGSRKNAQSSIIDQPNEEFGRSIIDEPNTLLPEISQLQGIAQTERSMLSSPAQMSNHITWVRSPHACGNKDHQIDDATTSLAAKTDEFLKPHN